MYKRKCIKKKLNVFMHSRFVEKDRNLFKIVLYILYTFDTKTGINN